MGKVKTALLATLMTCTLGAAQAQTPTANLNMDALLGAMRQEETVVRENTAATLSGIAAAMRRENQNRDRKLTEALTSVAAAMRREMASGTQSTPNGTDATGSVQYSTYGTDARADIANNATTATTNPFIMGEYAVGTTYAGPGAAAYLTRNYGPSQQTPVPGALTSGYGYRPSFGRMHHGVDLALNTGDTVRAAYDGKVVLVSNDPKGYGRYVKLQHEGGMETLYAHFTHPLVKHGQHVAAGQPIGIGGATGNATGPHLHFETRVGGVAVDPARFFNFGRAGGAGARKNTSPAISDGPRRNASPTQKDTPSRTPRLKTQTVASAATPQGTRPRPAAYQVRRGDTIEKIAREHGMSVGEICRLNKMSKYTPMYSGKVIRLK